LAGLAVNQPHLVTAGGVGQLRAVMAGGYLDENHSHFPVGNKKASICRL